MEMKTAQQPHARRYKAYISVLGTTQLHLRNPYVIAWWSAAFPGLGHLLLSKYLRGYLLFTWEVVVNTMTHINLAILYSFTGNFAMAKEVVNINWFILYFPTYLFAIWDSYRTTIDLNNTYILAERENANIQPFRISAVEINYLDKRSPWVALAWSALVPGAGQLYIHRILVSTFLLIWWIVLVYFSHLLPGLHLVLLGEFESAALAVDPQWLMNIPSVYFFAMYDAYTNTVENNKLFENELDQFLNETYQNTNFVMPLKTILEGGKAMYIIATFDHSRYLETALSALQMQGISKDKILAVPLDKRAERRSLFDTLHHSDGISLLDLPLILGTVLSLMGAIYGFVLLWGPIIWALIGLTIGIALGLAVKLYLTRQYTGDRQKGIRSSEVVIIVECQPEQIEMVKDTLWEHFALGVRKLDLNNGNDLLQGKGGFAYEQ